MSVNPYFNHTTFTSEQGLIQDLIDESIQIYGHDTAYLVRDAVDLDKLFGEDELAEYIDALPIEMYIKSSQSFSGQSEFMTKYGLHIEDQCTFSVSKRRWQTITANNAGPSRPRENDIVWLQMTPTNRYLFEIRFVEDKEQLFQLGSLYTYELRCELMNYSHERVLTGNADIDSIATDQAFALSLNITILNQPDANVTFIVGETVTQGDVNDPMASGLVTEYTAANSSVGVIEVQSISGTFASGAGVLTGETSGTTATLDATPDTRISSVAPDSDNIFITDAANDVIVIRGSNPRRS